MVSHSFVVCALMTFSLAVHAGVDSVDGMLIEANPTGTAQVGAVLHKDVGLQQGGGDGKDVMEAPEAAMKCVTTSCDAIAPHVQTMGDLLDLNKDSSGMGTLAAILLIVSSTIIYASRRSPSPK